MPNVPSTMGKIRARVTCIQNGVTHHGQSDYFKVLANESVDIGAITFKNPELLPVSIAYQGSMIILTSGPGTTYNLKATATYADGAIQFVVEDVIDNQIKVSTLPKVSGTGDKR